MTDHLAYTNAALSALRAAKHNLTHAMDSLTEQRERMNAASPGTPEIATVTLDVETLDHYRADDGRTAHKVPVGYVLTITTVDGDAFSFRSDFKPFLPDEVVAHNKRLHAEVATLAAAKDHLLEEVQRLRGLLTHAGHREQALTAALFEARKAR